jgi:histone-lysine N-methyltransferase SETD3
MSDDAIERMTAWLTAGGVRLGFAIQPVGDRERGACALAPIAEGDVVLQIPARFLMTDELARASEIGRKIAASGVKLSTPHSVLASFLLQERRDPGSFWRPFLDILPRVYPHMPVYYSERERFFLNGSFVLQLIDYRWHSYMADYKALVGRVPGFDQFTSHDFVWARLTVGTRLFGMTVRGERARALVPMADMLNHRWPQETSWKYDERAAAFVFTALRAFAPGDPIRTAYGKRSNSHLLVNYGFVLEDNEHNEAVLRLSVPQGDPLLDVKAAALESGGTSRAFQVAAGYARNEVRKMFSFLRFAHADAEELTQLTTPAGFDVNGIAPVSARNEEAALRAIGAAAKVALAAFDTTAEQDTAILRTLPLSPNMKSCVLLRRGEKRVLRHYADLAALAAPLLHLSRPALARFLASRPDLAAGPLAPYLEQVVALLVERRASGPITAR